MSELGGVVGHELILNRALKLIHRLAVVPVAILLLLVIVAGASVGLHAQLLKLGEANWESYYLLRANVTPPDCDPNLDIDTRLDQLILEVNRSTDLELDALFDPKPFNRAAARVSLESAQALCVKQHQLAEQTQARITPGVRLFRTLETGIEFLALFAYDNQRVLLVLLLFICAGMGTINHHHISFRPVKNQLDHHMSAGVALFANLVFLMGSMLVYDRELSQAQVAMQYPLVHQMVWLGILFLCALNALRWLAFPRDIQRVTPTKKNWLKSLLTIPLYTYMLLICGYYFFFAESHPAGLAIYVNQLFEYAGNFLNVGLYIWLGMLLKRTQLAPLVFDVFKPWRLPPEYLAFVAVVIMAVPTAFTGASGIIVIALGMVVYDQLRRVNTRRQLAFATTALTGSAGVVLKPCLLVVIIAALNKEVVTDELFGWGGKVFCLNMLFFFLVVWLTRTQSLNIAPWREALPASFKLLKPLLPYVLILLGVMLFYQYFLGTGLDEFSAPVILPLVVLAFIGYEHWQCKGGDVSGVQALPEADRIHRVWRASKETSVHVGALLMIMGLSFAVSGVIERTGFFEVLPETFSSPWVAMTLLVITLVGIGMIMEPFGAVVMVSGTIAVVAYNNQIHPVHFWMVTLVAFELGYLTPPVALNHLLTRQVVGEQEAELAAQEGHNFWYRHEKFLLPMVVMGLTLIAVAYGPLIYQHFS